MFAAGNEDLYAYRYDWDNLRDFFVGDFGKIIGSAHALEIPMISGDFTLLKNLLGLFTLDSLDALFQRI